MRFLIDNQLPRALAKLFQNLGHHAVHVLDVELVRVNDLAIWPYAAEHGYTIVSKDADFADLALLAQTKATAKTPKPAKKRHSHLIISIRFENGPCLTK